MPSCTLWGWGIIVPKANDIDELISFGTPGRSTNAETEHYYIFNDIYIAQIRKFSKCAISS